MEAAHKLVQQCGTLKRTCFCRDDLSRFPWEGVNRVSGFRDLGELCTVQCTTAHFSTIHYSTTYYISQQGPAYQTPTGKKRTTASIRQQVELRDYYLPIKGHSPAKGHLDDSFQNVRSAGFAAWNVAQFSRFTGFAPRKGNARPSAPPLFKGHIYTPKPPHLNPAALLFLPEVFTPH